jgi:hypothetical protein
MMILREFFMFVSLLAQRNEPKKVQPITCSAFSGIPEVYTPLRGTARKGRATSESRASAPPSRLSVLCGVYAPYLGVLLGCVKWQ